MAQEFDFTVRATDEAGSFADRNFSITVNNTVVPRFVAVNSTDIHHSNDGMEWFKNTGFVGIIDIEYGAGNWLALRTNQTLYRSTDGVNWSETAYTLDPGAPQPTHILKKAKYIAAENKWYGMTSQSNSAYFYESSDDGYNWDYIAQITGFVNTTQNPAELYKNGTDVVIRMDDDIRYSTDSGATWSIASTGALGNVKTANVLFVNNAWFVLSWNTGIYRSFNLSTWTQIQAFTSNDTLLYANGEVVARNGNSAYDIYISQDAGDNFTSTTPSNRPAGFNSANLRRGMAFYNGIFVWAGNAQIKWAIEPDVAWFDATPGNTGGDSISTPIAIAART